MASPAERAPTMSTLAASGPDGESPMFAKLETTGAIVEDGTATARSSAMCRRWRSTADADAGHESGRRSVP
jgi:hypothetical protein